MPYTYAKQLSKHELRLLQPISTRNGLYFRVVTGSRKSLRPYTAVSYTWGTDDATETIFLDDVAFSVRPNLWACLFHLTQESSHSNGVLFWVDAICINQDDVQERNAQVRLMEQTYRDAAYVSVWLGLLPLSLGAAARAQLSTRQAATLQVSKFDWWGNLNDLANRPYWRRFWVIQEMLLGFDVTIYCGNTSMHWLDFQTILCSAERVMQYGSDANNWDNHPFAALPLLMGRHPNRHPRFQEPLLKLLVRHGRSQCKDPRDRVFALLGLVSKEERRLLGRFFPDYGLSEEEVIILTLGHVMVPYLNLGGVITPDSDDFFLPFGIQSKIRRKKVIQMAKSIDYLSIRTITEARQRMAFHRQSNQNGLDDQLGLDPEHLQAYKVLLDAHEDLLKLGHGTSWLEEQRRSWTTSQKIVTLTGVLVSGYLVWRYLK